MGRFSYILIGAIILIAAWLRSEVLLLVGVIMALLAGASYLWTRYCMTALTYERRFGTQRLFMGEETDFFVQLTNAKPLPLPWLRIDDDIPGGINMATQAGFKTPVVIESSMKQDTDAALDSPQNMTQAFPVDEPTENPQAQSQQEEEELTLRGSRRGKRQLVTMLGMRWYERVTRRYRVRGEKRGAWNFGPARLRSGDIFGFNITHRKDEPVDEVLVYPRIVPVAALGLPARHPLGDFRSLRRVMDDPLRMMSVRDYAQGDNFRYIHWKASARRQGFSGQGAGGSGTQGLQTKIFEPSASLPVAIFVNINTQPSPVHGYEPELREFSISVGASLAQHLWQEGRAVGLFCNATDPGRIGHVRIMPRRSADQLTLILTALTRVDDAWGRWPLEKLLQLESTALPYGATVVVVTPVMTVPLRQTLIDLRRREYGVVLLTIGNARLDSPIPNIQAHHLGGEEEWHALAQLELA